MSEKSVHDSDCAVHNAPAFPAGKCDCGAGTISEVVEKISDGWGFQGWTVALPGGGTSGFYSQRAEAISRARMEWPFHEDDLSGQ